MAHRNAALTLPLGAPPPQLNAGFRNIAYSSLC